MPHGNFIKETTVTTGTGTVTLSQVAGFARFDVFSNGETTEYTIRNANNWETGVGTIGASNTLARTVVYATYVSGVYDDSNPTAITLAGSSTVACVNTAQNIDLTEQKHIFSSLMSWHRYNKGITVTGSGVSQWNDQSGNNNHLLQATDTNRPSKEADGSILFNGVDNFLKTNAFTLNQPTTVYILFRAVSFVTTDYIFDGNTTNSGSAFQLITEPRIDIFAGAQLGQLTSLLIGSYGVMSVVFNSTSSVLQHNNNTPITGDVGTNNMSGFTLGSRGAADGAFGNIQVKEIIIDDAAQIKQKVKNYLFGVGGLSV